MQNTASVPTNQLSGLLNRLPAGLDLDTLARGTKAIQRDRKIGGGANLLGLALARGPGGFSLRQSSGWVSRPGYSPSLFFDGNLRCGEGRHQTVN